MASQHEQKPSRGKSQRSRLQPADLLRIRLVGDPQVSPDGRTVAFVQTRLRKKKNDYASNIWLVPADGSEAPYKLTNSNARDMSPRWSPSGQEIAFVSTRSGKPQLWIIPVRGGEARQITYCKRGVQEIAWSPDGKWLAFTSQVDNEQDKRLAAEEKGKNAEAGKSVDAENRQPGQISGEGYARPEPGEWTEDTEDEKGIEDKGDHAIEINRVHTRGEGQGLLLRRTHIFIVPSGGGPPQQLTEGDWDASSPSWSPDGLSAKQYRLAYLANKEPDAELSSIIDIHMLAIDANGKPGKSQRVTAHNHAVSTLDWLPDGSGFAIFGQSRIHEGALATNLELERVSLKGEIVSLSASLDRTGGTFINSDLWAGTGELRSTIQRRRQDGLLSCYHAKARGTSIQFQSKEANQKR